MTARRLRACLLLGAAPAVIIGSLIWWLRRDSGEAAIERFRGAVEHREWATVYDLAPSEEMATRGISKTAFVSLCEELTSDLPRGATDKLVVEENKRVSESAKPGHVYSLLVFTQYPLVEGHRCEYGAVASNTVKGWKVSTGTLPIFFSRIHNLPEKERAQRMLAALRNAHVEQYPVAKDRALYCSGIERYLGPDGERGDMFRP
ncbi:MAG: hypothetical protein JSS66_12230 [Armatimonadetes bacterium]|nr:hypothetical protein [Armatimonadota bacterium]